MPIPDSIRESIRFGQDPASGSVIEQLTSDAVTSTNIYCEQRYTSCDGKRIAISRTPFGQPTQIWVNDMETLRLHPGVVGTPLGGNHLRNAIYYTTTADGEHSIMRFDLSDFSTKRLYACAAGSLPRVGAVSPDETTLVCGPFHVRDTIYSLSVLDLTSGEMRTLCEHEDIINPHLQIDPGGSGQCMLQINRGGRLDRTSKEYAGPLGATLAIVDSHTGEVTPLPVGRPDTPGISGHECWVGTTGALLFTAGQYSCTVTSHVTLKEPRPGEEHMPPAAIYSVSKGDTEPRVVAQGKLYNHVACSDDGNYFIADDHTTGRIYIGSIHTGKTLGLCDSHTRQGTCQYSHVHAYMTPDNRWVIFNSIVTGVAQVYAASVPEGFLATLD